MGVLQLISNTPERQYAINPKVYLLAEQLLFYTAKEKLESDGCVR